MADGKVGKDEIAGFVGAIEICHARRGDPGQNWRVSDCGSLEAAVSHRTGLLQCGKKEEVGIVIERDVLALLDGGTFDDAQFNNGRRVNGAAIGIRLHPRATGSCTFGLLENSKLIP